MKKHFAGMVFAMVVIILTVSCTPGLDENGGITSLDAPVEVVAQTIVPMTPTANLVSSPTITVQSITVDPQQDPTLSETETPSEGVPTQEPLSSVSENLFLEQQLQALGFVETGIVDGVVDQQTALAIAHLEWLNGMPITGEVSPELLALIRTGDVTGMSSQPPYPARALSRYLPGGTEVGFLKGRLVDLGYLDDKDPSFYPFSFDETTEEAVRQFQNLNGLPTNGVVDFKNWAAIFHPAAITSNGESLLSSFDSYEWKTEFYPLLEDPIDVAYDGEYIWVLHSSGDDAFDNLVVRIDPQTGLLDQYPPVMVGDIETWENRISQMVFDGNRLYFLMPRNSNPPQMVILIPSTAEKFVHTRFNDWEKSFPADALGFDGSKIWATDHDRAWMINRNTGKAYNSYVVGWSTKGEMAFDGKCMWMAGESGLAAFHTGGDYACPGANMAYALPSGPVVFDGRRIWTAGWNAVYWLDTKSGTIGDAIMVGSGPSALAFDGKTLWVANQGDDTVQGVDVATGSVGPTLPTGSQPVSLVHDGQHLWVVNAGDRTLQCIEVQDYQIEIIQPTATPVPSATLIPTPTLTPTLPPLERSLKLESPYMRGDDVRQLQKQLVRLGFDDLLVDHIFGPKTDEVVRHFQTLNNLVVDGIVGPATWAVLFSKDAKGP